MAVLSLKEYISLIIVGILLVVFVLPISVSAVVYYGNYDGTTRTSQYAPNYYYGDYSYNNYGQNYYDSSYYYNQPYYSTNYCGVGFVNKGGSCISHTEDCRRTFGANMGYGVAGTNNNSVCYCASGFDWNYNRTSCVSTSLSYVYDSNYNYNYNYPVSQGRSFIESQIASLQSQISYLRNLLSQYGW